MSNFDNQMEAMHQQSVDKNYIKENRQGEVKFCKRKETCARDVCEQLVLINATNWLNATGNKMLNRRIIINSVFFQNQDGMSQKYAQPTDKWLMYAIQCKEAVIATDILIKDRCIARHQKITDLK